MLDLKKSVLKTGMTLALALLPLYGMQAASALTIATKQQGMQQLKALNGKLIVIAGTYQDTTSYKRSLTFYFEEKAGAEWLHVPVMESEADHDLTFFSISHGDDAVADAVFTTQGADNYLIVAEKKGSGVVAHWYKFAAAGADYPDGPAYMFKPAGSKTYAKNTNPTVESVLSKEVRTKAKQ